MQKHVVHQGQSFYVIPGPGWLALRQRKRRCASCPPSVWDSYKRPFPITCARPVRRRQWMPRALGDTREDHSLNVVRALLLILGIALTHLALADNPSHPASEPSATKVVPLGATDSIRGACTKAPSTPSSGPASAHASAAPVQTNVLQICADRVHEATAVASSAATPPPWAASSALAADLRLQQSQNTQQLAVQMAYGFAGALIVCSVGIAFMLIIRDDRSGFRVTSHWGGFGGATGGWQMTRGLVALVIAAGMACAAVMLVAAALQASSSANGQQAQVVPGVTAK